MLFLVNQENNLWRVTGVVTRHPLGKDLDCRGTIENETTLVSLGTLTH